MPIIIRHYEGLNRTPALPLAEKAQAELKAEGLTENASLISWDHQAFVAFEFDVAVGVITFGHTKWLKQLDISLGYVEPDRRGTGVYRALWAALVVHAQKVGAVEICGSTSVRNQRMRDVAKALGRAEVGVILKFTVPAAEA